MATNDILPHILLPLPNLKEAPKTASLSRDEKLKEIISNLENQQQRVRHNIILATKNSLDTSLQSPSRTEDDDRMDIDDPPPETDRAAATQLLLANISAPYVEGSGDPCVTSTSNRPVAPQEIRQVTPPPQIQAAKEALDQIDQYNLHANKAKDYYVRALERRRSSAGLNPALVSSAAHSIPHPPRQFANASPIDFNRDPRRRGR